MTYRFWGDRMPKSKEEIIALTELPSVMIPPNMTGPLHVASGAVLWLGAREAQARGARFHVRFDLRGSGVDRPGYPAWSGAFDMRQQIATIRSAIETCELLGLEGVEFTSRVTYEERYREVARLLKEAGEIVELFPETWYPKNMTFPVDLATGVVPASRDLAIGFNDWLAAPLVTCVEYHDFNVPIHIRGRDIQEEAAKELQMWPLICKVLGPKEFPKFAHIPIIWRAEGAPLHKSEMELGAKGTLVIAGPSRRNREPADPYIFTNWAKKFNTVEERREALERIVFKPGLPHTLDNLVNSGDARPSMTSILYDAERDTTRYLLSSSNQMRLNKRLGLLDWAKGKEEWSQD